MTTPIKPPAGPTLPVTDGPAAVDSTSSPDAFARVLQSKQTAASEAGPAPGTAIPSSHPIAKIQADLRAGRIDLQGAIDQLVAHAVQKAPGLTGAGKAQLEAHVRQSLLEDPTLAGLVRDLQRGG